MVLIVPQLKLYLHWYQAVNSSQCFFNPFKHLSSVCGNSIPNIPPSSFQNTGTLPLNEKNENIILLYQIRSYTQTQFEANPSMLTPRLLYLVPDMCLLRRAIIRYQTWFYWMLPTQPWMIGVSQGLFMWFSWKNYKFFWFQKYLGSLCYWPIIIFFLKDWVKSSV